jgi:hypothetical protein
MSMEMLRCGLLWCTVMNYAVLMIWFLVYLLAHRWLHRIWGWGFHLTAEQFDTLNFAGMMVYKLGILLFNLVPLVALCIAARR